jgi:hypothetical protein
MALAPFPVVLSSFTEIWNNVTTPHSFLHLVNQTPTANFVAPEDWHTPPLTAELQAIMHANDSSCLDDRHQCGKLSDKPATGAE